MSTATLDTTTVRRWKRYPEYRPANLDWQEHVPSHWQILPLKRRARIRYGLGQPPAATPEGLPLIRATNVKRGRIAEEGMMYVDPAAVPASRDAVLCPGDIIVVRSGAYTGDSAIIPPSYAGAIAGYDMVVRARKDHSPYLSWQFLAPEVENYQFNLVKLRAAQPHLNAEELGETLVCLPPLTEQRAIAAFLDRETARIDALIGHKERLIALLEEKRQAVISHAVTRGLDPSTRLKHFCDILPGFAFPSEGFSREPDDVRLLRGTNVIPGRTDWSEVVRWPKHDCNSYSDYELKVGDIVFGMDRPWIKSGIRVARITKEDLPCLLLQRVARLRARPGMCQDYLELLLNCREFTAYFEPILTGVSVPHISPEQILDFRFWLPTLPEQESICSKLTAEFDAMKRTGTRIHDGITRLQEYRTALISAAVTGQIDVRGEVEWPAEEEPT